jgi:hypothetical protein
MNPVVNSAMASYERLWRGVCLTVCLIGVAVGCATVPATVFGLATVFALIASFATFVLSEDQLPVPTRRERAGRIVHSAAVAGGCAGAFVGVAVVLQGTAFAVLFLLVATSPYAVRAWSSRCRPTLPSLDVSWASVATAMACAGGDYQLVPTVPRIDELTDRELCAAWQQSCSALDAATSAQTTARVVRERAVYVEELARRYPVGVTAWLIAGPVAVPDPLAYLNQSHSTSPGIDWNLLIPGQDQ